MHVAHAYGATPAALFAVLTDPAYLAARSARFGGAGEPRVEHDGGRTVVRIPRALPLEAVPGALKRFVGDGTLVQVDEWTDVADEHAHGTWTAEVGSVPLELDGTHEVRIDGHGGSVYTVTARVKVRVPVVGRAAEKSVDEHLATLVTRELAFADDWLRG
jgi:photosystem II stability/assembly factor-like uncharacterized protein